MSDPYEILVVIPEGIDQEKAVHETHNILGIWGGYLSEDSTLWLEDIGDEEYEPQELEEASEKNIEEFLEKLSQWPTFGFLMYEMPWCMLSVSYMGQPYSKKVNAILMGLLRGAFDDYRKASEPFYVELSKVLHEHFHAKRTVMDYSVIHAILPREPFDLEEELERLRNNKFLGEYKILDLRREEAAIEGLEVKGTSKNSNKK
jgi:hypothetical protein